MFLQCRFCILPLCLGNIIALTLLVCVYLGSTLEQMIHRRKHFHLLKLFVVDL